MLRKLTVAIASAGLALGLTACGSSDSGSDDVLTVGASPAPHAEILEYVKDELAAGAGLKLEIEEFSDYVQPNLALNDGRLDANYFQHKPYMDDFASSKGLKLAFVAPVHLEPLGAYSKKVKALAELPQGATVAIPNDATNGARALKLLADNGLITLKPGAGTNATEKDVAGNPKGLKFRPLEAAQLPRSLQDVDAAVINGNFAIEGGLTPAKDALVLEKTQGNPYANGVVTKAGDENDPQVRKLVQLLQGPEVKKFIQDKYQGSVLAVS
ncbi:MetQ/NlpA family ABC transporter substrate-binding protein [Thermomonospora cellulosilytica]|uniref:Lipoprotein n=1 Tax=Thermomonospora cellulosilytica TaxID=1411118 RepID=A0A7W3MYW1_9ACTN|nr:MetQ/NlpA family ABC transporter substrate-binding protein [Thermomonospora cellulosilytica]MBA9004406.1 D-methionine transport system substrate-binding protein [Thermomonospora cellulosilytica]